MPSPGYVILGVHRAPPTHSLSRRSAERTLARTFFPRNLLTLLHLPRALGSLLPRLGGTRGARHPSSREATVAPGASSPLQRDRSRAAPPPQSARTDSPWHQCAPSGWARGGVRAGGGNQQVHLRAVCSLRPLPPAFATHTLRRTFVLLA